MKGTIVTRWWGDQQPTVEVKYILTTITGGMYDREVHEEDKYLPLDPRFIYIKDGTEVEFYESNGQAVVTTITPNEAKVIEMFPEPPLTSQELKEVRQALSEYRDVLSDYEYRDAIQYRSSNETQDDWDDNNDDYDDRDFDDESGDEDDSFGDTLWEKPVLVWRKPLLYSVIIMLVLTVFHIYLPVWINGFIVFNMVLTLFMLYQNGVRHNFAPPKIF